MAFSLEWFPFYVKDFFTDEHVAAMDHAAVGCYVRLLGHQWIEGSIPADQRQVARILKIDREAMKEMWEQLEPCFPPCIRHKDRLVNPRLEDERAKAMTILEHKKNAGRKGGLAKARGLKIVAGR